MDKRENKASHDNGFEGKDSGGKTKRKYYFIDLNSGLKMAETLKEQ